MDYTAAAPPSDEFRTLYQSARGRLDLFNRLVALYGRLNFISNYGEPDYMTRILREVRDTVVGAELSWRWLRAGAEYEEYASNLSPYRAARLFQSFSFEPSEYSTLTLDFAQSRTDNLEPYFTRRDVSSIGRYRARVASPLYFSLEGGIRRVRGAGVDQDTAAVRTMLDFALGQLTANATYEFLDDTYLGQRHLKNNFILWIKRAF